MTRPLLLATVVLLAAALPAAGQAQGAMWESQLVAADLEAPVDVAFGPDGTLYYAELESGKVRAIPPGASAPLAEPVASVNSVRSENGGFLGLAVDPDFERTGAFYVYYSMEKAGAKNGQVNRVSRVDASGETVLVDDIGFFERHNGGRLLFTDPNTLVVVTGDNEERAPAQDMTSLLGKTLRMTKDGQPAPDNPDPTSLIYTLGHRNPFGLAYDAENDVLWNTENGPQANDEINILEAGKNYGWPERVGITGSRTYAEPVFEYEKTIGPTGATVLDGVLYFGAVNDGKVRSLTKAANGTWVDAVVADFVTVLDVEAFDGRLYVSTFDEIHVVMPPGVAPPTSATPAPGTPPATPPTAPSTAGTPPTSGAPASPLPSQGAADPTPEGAAAIPAPGAALALAGLAVALLARRARG